MNHCKWCDEPIDTENGDDELIFQNEYYHSPCYDEMVEGKDEVH